MMAHFFRFEVSSFYRGSHNLIVCVHRDKGIFHRVLCDLGLVDIVLCVRSLKKHKKLIIFDYFLCLLLSSDVLIHFTIFRITL